MPISLGMYTEWESGPYCNVDTTFLSSSEFSRALISARAHAVHGEQSLSPVLAAQGTLKTHIVETRCSQKSWGRGHNTQQFLSGQNWILSPVTEYGFGERPRVGSTSVFISSSLFLLMVSRFIALLKRVNVTLRTKEEYAKVCTCEKERERVRQRQRERFKELLYFI